jgi:hypothetical protein
MSPTTTTLATNALSAAFERIETIYENLIDELHSKLLGWGLVDADMRVVQTADVAPLVDDIRRAAVTKWVLSQLIRTRPDELPPTGLTYPALFVGTIIPLGDAVTLDEIANATAYLRDAIHGSSWDLEAKQAEEPKVEEEVNDGLGFSSDLGEVGPGPAEVEAHDEDAARQ